MGSDDVPNTGPANWFPSGIAAKYWYSLIWSALCSIWIVSRIRMLQRAAQIAGLYMLWTIRRFNQVEAYSNSGPIIIEQISDEVALVVCESTSGDQDGEPDRAVSRWMQETHVLRISPSVQESVVMIWYVVVFVVAFHRLRCGVGKMLNSRVQLSMRRGGPIGESSSSMNVSTCDTEEHWFPAVVGRKHPFQQIRNIRWGDSKWIALFPLIVDERRIWSRSSFSRRASPVLL